MALRRPPAPTAFTGPTGKIERSLGHHSLFALAVVLLLVGGLGTWSALTNISGAIVAGGTLVVATGSQKVQHPEGGIVGEIFAHDEDHVTAGQILLRLDGTTVAASLAVVESQLREAYAQMARLYAESAGKTELVPPPAAGDLASGSEFASLMEAQRQLLEARAATRQQQVERLQSQITQLEGQSAAIAAQQTAAQGVLDILTKENEALTSLKKQALVDSQRLNAVRQQLVAQTGELGRLSASLAETNATIAERNLQIGQVGADFLAAVMTDLQTVRQTVAGLQQQRIAALDRLSRLEIRAPQSGVIHESIVHTVGGVVSAGDTLMLVVPEANGVLVDARLTQFDVDKVSPGQAVVLRFPSLDQRVTPELKGVVKSISPDIIRDPVTGQPYYSMRVAALPGEAEKLPEGTRLIPGMPVEAFAQLGERSVLSYLLHPVTEQLSRMFIEK